MLNSKLSDVDRAWMNHSMTTVSTMKTFFEDRRFFTMLAGATFALHQDTLRAYSVDMRHTDDMVMAAALDRSRPSPLGDFPTRVSKVMDVLTAIDDANLDLVEKATRPSGIDAQEFNAERMIARMRSLAARIWLLTIYSKANALHTGSVQVMWRMLEMVSPEEAHTYAKEFTGTFFQGVKSETMNLKNWPQS